MEHGHVARSGRWHRLSLAVMAAGVAALIGAAALLVLNLTGAIGETSYSGPGTVTGFGNIDSLPPPQPTPTVPPSNAPIARIVIPKIEVDAPISTKGVDANGVMETPDGPWDVAWYDFSARPGFGSNAVFSGHVDYVNVGPAVFWGLKDLTQGDIVDVRLDDGTAYQYRVAAMETIDAATADIGRIIGATEQEVVTLITCIGTFNQATGQYDQRLIVRAERIFGDAVGLRERVPHSSVSGERPG